MRGAISSRWEGRLRRWWAPGVRRDVCRPSQKRRPLPIGPNATQGRSNFPPIIEGFLSYEPIVAYPETVLGQLIIRNQVLVLLVAAYLRCGSCSFSSLGVKRIL